MTIIDPTGPATLSETLRRRMQTAAIDDAELASSQADESHREDWDRIIDHCLIEWGRDPSSIEDEDVIAPSVEVIRLACRVARDFRDQGLPPPDAVFPDGDGGIAFERGGPDCHECIEVSEELEVELLVFNGSRLVARHPIW